MAQSLSEKSVKITMHKEDMKKNTLMITAAAALLLLSTVSCKPVRSDKYYTTYMTAVSDNNSSDTKSDNNSISYFVSDDSIKIFPGNVLQIMNTLKNNDRVIASFTIPSGEITNPVQAEFASMSQLYEDNITVSDRIDTLGKSPMSILSAWHSGGIYNAGRFITIVYSFQGTGFQFHTMALVDDTSLEQNPDNDGYYHLRLTHDNGNDIEASTMEGITTYPLTEKYTGEGIKGIKITYVPIPSIQTDSVAVINF